MKKSTLWVITLLPLILVVIFLGVPVLFSGSNPVFSFMYRASHLIQYLEPIIIIIIGYYFLSSLVKFIIYIIKKNNEKKIIAGKDFLQSMFMAIVLFLQIAIISATNTTFGKPVIYLYPTSTEKVQVKLDLKGTIIADYPKYDFINGWNVTASPDGTITNQDGKKYSYLFWEGKSDTNTKFDLSTGFVVRGEDTREFLQSVLPKFGFTPKEYNEFVVYWYPLMQNNKYNLIHFATTEYTDAVGLNITPKPDSVLRVFMVYKPLQKSIEIKSQEIQSFDRKGFSVVEWGGSEVK